ncbi:PREDICTED: uncharacterized protein LOC106324508 [Brassica oleracea var. oleracea]|uniref:uncharacterized protein LOC106324508 n=1 Tax=Brassica oleracea var. oleracea TaxID=109376 RepID=UPI0006A736FE|nr:PREDICTED: uncharacterized protein LOC106324508 [Brassica oleracea var. oleracea]
MVLVPKYKKAKGQHKSMRSDLNLAKNVIKKFEHPVIQGKTMYSYFSGGSNEGGTWRSIGSAANTDGPATISDLHSFIEAFISSKKAGTHSLDFKLIIIDSGANHHMISDRNLISDVQPASDNVLIANGDKFTSNLLSMRKATVDLSCQVVFRPDGVEFQDLKTGQMIGKGHVHNKFYHLQKTGMSEPSTSRCLASTSSRVDSTLWHARLGHPHTRALNLMLPNAVFKNDDCETCILGKHYKTVFPQSSTINERCFDLAHSDVWTASCVSRENHKYFATFIDEKSKYTWVTLIQSKDKVLGAFKNFQTHICNHFNAKLKILRTPTKVLNDMSPFEVLNKTKPSLDHFRVFGCLCFVLIPGEKRNKLEAKRSKAMFVGYSPTQKGYTCYDPVARRVLVSRDVKFVESKGYYDEKSWESLQDLSQGLSDRANNLRIILESLGISHPRSIEVPRTSPSPPAAGNNEEAAPVVETVHPDLELGNEPESQSQERDDSASTHDQDGVESDQLSEDQFIGEQVHEEAVVEEQQIKPLRRSTRVKKPSKWVDTRVYFNNNAMAHPIQATCSFASYPQEHVVFISNLDQEYVPNTYEEAMEHEEWRKSVGDEVGAMIKNDTWYETELPKGKKAFTSRLLFTIKYLANGKP